MESIITVEKLEKSYKDKKVIHGISFDVKKGEILCFLGPNGAGKTTSINILLGALGYEAGTIRCKNRVIKTGDLGFKKLLGVVPQDLALYDDLSARRNVQFFASLYGLRDGELKRQCDRVLEFAGLSDRANDKVKTFSGGMKRRLNIACAIAHNPEILIMDEPTVGIDPQSRNHILSSIKQLRDAGMTIIYTTHYMEEVEEISDRIIIMDNGRIIAQGTKEELKENIANDKQYIIELDSPDHLKADQFYKIEGIKKVKLEGTRIEITTLKGIENLDRIISIILNSSAKINNITTRMASLETVFLELTGKSLRD
jgi:ABC-2 type transport system ATP-binding protein